MKRALRYLRPYGGTVAASLTIKFIGSIAELFLPMLLDYVMSGDRTLTEVIISGVLMLVCSFVALFGNSFANRLSVKAAAKMTHDLRYDLFEKTENLKSGQTDAFGVPSLITRLTSDTYYVNQMVARTMRMGVRAPILLVGGLIMSFILDPVLALVLTATVPFVSVALYFITRQSIPMYAAVQKSGDDMVRATRENASGIRIIKALSKTEYENEKFAKIADRLAADEYRANKIMSLSNPVATLVLSLGLVAVVVVGALRGNAPSTVLAFLTYFTIILNGMLGLSKIFVIISRGAASAARVEKVLETDCTEFVGEYPAGNSDYKLQFEDVSFSYNGAENNIDGVSFRVKEGQTLGIIGATGSGKSTLINLMMRFYDVGRGRICIDGKDVRTYPVAELRKKFGVAFQSDFLTSSSVLDNVDFGRELPLADVEAAIDAAQAREFVDGLEGGLSYNLSQKAANLSGGQKQRLLIARALAGRPEILVLDDSSSALDYRTDAKLRKALAENYPDSTKVIVAQRVSSVKNADLILVMDDGRVVGAGDHESLLRDCAEYRLIYSVQMGGDYA